MELIYAKSVDKSVLTDGFSIKTIYLDMLTSVTGVLQIGETRRIKLLFNGMIYDGIELKNQAFNRAKYPTHKEMYQVRYAGGSEFSKALRLFYSDVWEYICRERELQNIRCSTGEKRQNIKLPKELNRTIAFFKSDIPDVWIVEAYGANDIIALQESINTTDELNYERTDNDAKIIERTKTVRLRMLDRQVGNTLKKLYNYQCQVCGQSIGSHYGNPHIVDAHHIKPFTQTQNNDYTNIMVLCPNHHRIIHNCNGIYKPRPKEIWYPNGFHEPLMINHHL